MPQLNHFPVAKQATDNSCWASTGRAINNFYKSIGQSGPNPEYKSDQAFADACAKAGKDSSYQNIEVQNSAPAALAILGYSNSADERALPTEDEITKAINEGTPLLAIVAEDRLSTNRNLNVRNGHWVVITGISEDQRTIDVFDPDNGKINTVDYNTETYRANQYWQNTSYVDPNSSVDN